MQCYIANFNHCILVQNVYFSIKFGAAGHFNTNLRLKIRVDWGGILSLKLRIAMFCHTKFDDYIVLFI